ncbi:MAG: bifunctional phosphopantothenoylcysteine decarboxylase/phosphopantothenate--cysteine ligase CoaBC [Myxococcota bacterium]
MTSAGPSRVLLVVSGGIAAYKAPEIVRALTRGGAEVQVVATEAALSFVTELSLGTVSGRPVRTTLLDAAAEGRVGHIELADWPDVVLVAPATAHLIARAALGLADDLASTVLLATRAPVLWAPAMNTNMWRHVATQQNLARLAERGHRFVGPDRGDLACGWVGEGRMIDPPIIAAEVEAMIASRGDWSGRRVLVSAGPTRAHLDPVRYLTNASTGAMGFALAGAAAARGAEVTLVAGPVQQPTPPGVRRIDVVSALEMLDAMDATLRDQGCDWVAMVAAVSDLEATRPSSDKLPKDQLEAMLAGGAWKRGVDVLATLTERHGSQCRFLGFGAQTLPAEVTAPAEVAEALRAVGEAKLEAKGCDALFVNRVGVPATGFASPTNTGLLLRRRADGPVVVQDAGPVVPKATLADWILTQLGDDR